MKRLICLCIALSMVLTLGAAAVTAASPADSGWSAYQDDYTGWDISGQTITGTFGTGSSNWLRKACLDDVKNFVLDVDISGNNTSSPYIKVLNNVIEVEGNNGNGEQVYVKIADQAKDWLAAAGTRVHIKVLRVDGGDLQIKLTGANNDRSVIYTAPVRSKDGTVEIGMYRGIIRVENFTVRHLIYAMLEGMTDELHTMYCSYRNAGGQDAALIGSGNGLRKNVYLQECFSRAFGQPVVMSHCNEEAATGAALFAASNSIEARV